MFQEILTNRLSLSIQRKNPDAGALKRNERSPEPTVFSVNFRMILIASKPEKEGSG